MNCDMESLQGILVVKTQSGDGPGRSAPAGALENESFLGFSWDDVHNFASATAAKCYRAGFECEQRVVFTNTDVATGVILGSALTNQNFTSVDVLATETLHAEKLGVGVTTVTCGASTFFCCHELNPLRVLPIQSLLDIGDLHAGLVLTVTLTLFVTGLVFVFLDNNFLSTVVLKHLCGNSDFFQLCFI